jgi:hypothetical protein
MQRITKRTPAQKPPKGFSRKLSLAQKRALSRKGAMNGKREGVSRRQFVGTAAAAGATLALTPHLDAAHKPKKKRRTLFFDFAHENYRGRTYYLVLGSNRYRLDEAGPSHPAVVRARKTNRLLQAVPDSAITHVLENAELPADAVVLGYTLADANTATGTWAMPSFYLNVPPASVSYAYKQARKNLSHGEPLPLSAKRMKYGVPAAVSLQDLLDEQDLLTSTDWAKSMVNVHPEMLSADPNSAATIYYNHIDARSTFQLSQALEQAGNAVPQESATPDSSNNSSGWATLVPYTDEDGVTPLKNTQGANKGLILYDAKWRPSISTFVAAAMKPTSSAVKNDPTLGADVTGGSASLTAADLTGTIWYRHDGIANVDQSPGVLSTAQTSGGANFTLSNLSPFSSGYSVSAASSGDPGTVTLNFTNWYLRWLGLYIQFLDGNRIVPTSEIPKGISADPDLDEQSSVFLGIVTPEFTIYGVPVQASTKAATFTFPASVATSARILASGLGYGSHTYQETETVGIVTTSIFNLIIPPLLLGLGVGSDIDVIFKTWVFPVAQGIAVEAADYFVNAPLSQMGTIFWRLFVRGVATPFLKQLFTGLAGLAGLAAAEDAIPIVGVIFQAIGALATIAELDETTIEVLLSPWTYEYNLVGTHDLSVTLKPDPNDSGGVFPAAAATYTVTAIFDYGTPHTQTLNMPGTGVQTLPAVTFPGVPLGGNVTVSVAFYTAAGTCAALVGHGTTSVTNDVGASPTITITEDRLPITSGTVYMHKQKTTLDAQGNHVWASAPAPAVAPPVCENNPGNLCSFRNITVSSLGYIGYGWQSYNNAGCGSGGAGQLDQMANIFVSNGSGGNAQSGYASTPCALEPGTKLVYDPLGRPGANYYLDSSNNNNLIRQVQLNPPAFPDPGSNNAWGKFNLNSDDLLLHPAGALVSINSNSSRIESLHLPTAAVTDAEAAVSLLANLHGGLGNRPGLFNTPTVSTITSDGVILILESGNNRIHALDVAANPVQHFKNQPTQYFLNFSATGGGGTLYLDMAVEFSGFIYVLSVSNSVYRLDIYHPDQSGTNPISTTMGFNAAKVTVDYWRNVYSLNYEVLMTPNGSLPASGVTEPSISQWIPATPPPCEGQAAVAGRFQKQQQFASLGSPRRPLRRRDFWRACV